MSDSIDDELKQRAYIRKLKAEIRMLQIRVREANRGARNNWQIYAQLALDNRDLRRQIRDLTPTKGQP